MIYTRLEHERPKPQTKDMEHWNIGSMEKSQHFPERQLNNSIAEEHLNEDPPETDNFHGTSRLRIL